MLGNVNSSIFFRLRLHYWAKLLKTKHVLRFAWQSSLVYYILHESSVVYYTSSVNSNFRGGDMMTNPNCREDGWVRIWGKKTTADEPRQARLSTCYRWMFVSFLMIARQRVLSCTQVSTKLLCATAVSWAAFVWRSWLDAQEIEEADNKASYLGKPLFHSS